MSKDLLVLADEYAAATATFARALALKDGADSMSPIARDAGDKRAVLAEALAALDTAQPEPVNQVLLKALSALLTHSGMDEDEWSKPTFDQARAAIKLATTKTKECGMCGYVGTEADAVGQCPRCHWDELQLQKPAQQAQPVCGYDDTTGNCTRVNCCKQAQPERVTTAMVEGLQNAADKLEVIQARGIERDKCLAAFEQAQPERAPSDAIDAKRYRYWRENHGWTGYFDDGATNSESNDDVDKAIDAAIKQGGQHD